MRKDPKSAIKCWNCGYPTMEKCDELGSGWFRCSRCGATWTKPVKLGASPLTLRINPETGVKGYSPKPVRRVKESKK